MKHKHTPAPWTCKPISDRVMNSYRGYQIHGKENENSQYIRDVKQDEIEGNAKLISQAPAMAALLQEIVDYWDSDLSEGEKELKTRAVCLIEQINIIPY